MRWISENEFREALLDRIPYYDPRPRAVTGPGRSGAIAAVYASHILGIPFIPEGCVSARVPYPLLVIDTARASGATLRRATKRAEQFGTVWTLAVYEEPPRVGFWYEAKAPK